MRWANENTFDAEIAAAAAAESIPAPLLKAVIGQESKFDPNAIRLEPHGEASRGLMQLLYATAQEVGYAGAPEGLFDPAVNVALGARYLKKKIAQAGSADGGISAYNGGYRPEIGFGAPATHPLTVCLAHDAAGNCIQTHAVAAGEFANQAYVNAVRGNLTYFAGIVGTTSQEVASAAEAGASSPAWLLWILAVVLAVLLYLAYVR